MSPPRRAGYPPTTTKGADQIGAPSSGGTPRERRRAPQTWWRWGCTRRRQAWAASLERRIGRRPLEAHFPAEGDAPLRLRPEEGSVGELRVELVRQVGDGHGEPVGHAAL